MGARMFATQRTIARNNWRRLIILGLFGVAIVLFLSTGLSKPSRGTFYAAIGANKSYVVQGESLEYGITVRNDGRAPLTNVTVVSQISDRLVYIAGTSTAYKDDKPIVLNDDWLQTGVNLGTLVPGTSAIVRFKFRLPFNVTIGEIIESAVHIRADGTDGETWAHQLTVVSAEDVAEFGVTRLVQVANNSLQSPFSSAVQADAYNVLELRAIIENHSNHDARNVAIYVTSAAPAASLPVQVSVTADNAQSVEGTVVVKTNFPTIVSLRRERSFLFGQTDLYPCPVGCPINESFTASPLVLGTLPAGNTVQVSFLLDVLPFLTPTAVPPTPFTRPLVSADDSVLSIAHLTRHSSCIPRDLAGHYRGRQMAQATAKSKAA
jgi:uncharacterized repeat protein (TIGR01451 family)